MTDSQESPKTSKKSQAGHPINLFAVQCGECFKWRVISTQEEYEEIRSKFIEEPFFCHNKPDVSCEDPADIEYDATRTWVIDKPNIPKTPEGFKRELVVRKNFAKMDTYYITPTGKKVRGPTDLSAFLKGNPKYKGVSIAEFNFTVAKIMADTVPENVDEINGSASGNKRSRTSKEDDA